MVFAGSPLWFDFLILLGMCAAAFELGRYFGRRVLRAYPADEANSSDSHALSGVFGLLALLMAFSFGMALDRYEERRALVVEEANALSTLASRVNFLPPAQAAQVRVELASYARERLAFGRALSESQAAQAAIRAEAIHARIGSLIYDSLVTSQGDSRGPSLLQPFNQAGDIANSRLAAREAHLPDAVLVLLCLFCVAGAAMLGYSRASSARAHRPAALVFLALLAVAFVTVLDLDRPRGGSIQVPQKAMERQGAALIAAASLRG